MLVCVVVTVVLIALGVAADGSDRVASLPGHPGDLHYPQFAGTTTIDDATDSHLFYWYVQGDYYEEERFSTVLWLNGGPGCSSLTGLLQELGPYRLTYDGHASYPYVLEDNPYSWSTAANLLFIDQPVGTGYSALGDPEGLAQDEDQVAEQLYTAVCKFFGSLHREFQPMSTAPFFVAGESYAGKYLTKFATRILQGGQYRTSSGAMADCVNLHLSGVMLGDALVDPYWQRTAYPAQAHANSLIDATQRAQADSIALHCQSQLLQGYSSYVDDHHPCDDIRAFILEASGPISPYDLRSWEDPYNRTLAHDYLNTAEVRAALHANVAGLKHEYTPCNATVHDALRDDIYISQKHLVPNLLSEGIKMLFYNGQFDLQDGPLGTERWLASMEWAGRDAFAAASRLQWTVEGQVAGYVRKSLGLSFVVVNGAGHFLPRNQPEAALAMFRAFVRGQDLAEDPGHTAVNALCAYLDGCGEAEDRGSCVSGRCQCNTGYAGQQCSFSVLPLSLCGADTSVTATLPPLAWAFYTLELQGAHNLPLAASMTVLAEGGEVTQDEFSLYVQYGTFPSQEQFLYSARAISGDNSPHTLQITLHKWEEQWVIGIFHESASSAAGFQLNYSIECGDDATESSVVVYETETLPPTNSASLVAVVIVLSIMVLLLVALSLALGYVLVRHVLAQRAEESAEGYWKHNDL